MSNINDLWISYLKSEGYTGNSLPDLLKQALQDRASSTAKSIGDLWKDFLTVKGYTGEYNTALYEYLGSLGYTGTLNDRLAASLVNGDFLGFTPKSLYSSTDGGDYWDLEDTSTLYQDAARTTPVTTIGDVVGSATGIRGYSVTQETSARKMIYLGDGKGCGANLDQSTTGLRALASSLGIDNYDNGLTIIQSYNLDIGGTSSYGRIGGGISATSLATYPSGSVTVSTGLEIDEVTDIVRYGYVTGGTTSTIYNAGAKATALVVPAGLIGNGQHYYNLENLGHVRNVLPNTTTTITDFTIMAPGFGTGSVERGMKKFMIITRVLTTDEITQVWDYMQGVS